MCAMCYVQCVHVYVQCLMCAMCYVQCVQGVCAMSNVCNVLCTVCAMCMCNV